MDIQLGTIYYNKTKDYVLPSLQEYGKAFEKKFTNLFKLAIGLGDFALLDMGVMIDHSLFILVDTKFARKNFIYTMEWLRSQNYYQFDYPFDDVHSGHLHMIVVSIPERFKKSIDHFKKGEYSQMYSYQDIENFFFMREDIQSVFKKDPQMLVEFVEEVNKLYNTEVDHIGWKGEADFPPKDEQEYFNFNLIKDD